MEMEKGERFSREGGILPEEGGEKKPEVTSLKPAEGSLQPGQTQEAQQPGQEPSETHQQKPEIKGGQEHEFAQKIPKMMKAVQIVDFGKPVEIKEVEVPKPGPGEVLVRMSFCGVCHTDLKLREKSSCFMPENLPQIIGHEGVGRVYAKGPGVKNMKEGDRVLCGVLAESCGCCPECLNGCETACQKRQISGCTKDGQMAQFYLAKARFLTKIPDNVADEAAAPMNCAGVTAFKALKVSGLRCGQSVVIVGASGGVGYYALQFAKAMGLKVIAIDKGKKNTDFLKQFEPLHILDCNEGNVENNILKLTNNCGAHAALVLAPVKEVLEEAPKYVRKRGKLVVVGQPPTDDDLVPYDMASMIINCHTIVGSLIGTRCDLWEALQLLASGKVKSEVTIRGMDEINNILDEISKGQVLGRDVLKIPEVRQD